MAQKLQGGIALLVREMAASRAEAQHLSEKQTALRAILRDALDDLLLTDVPTPAVPSAGEEEHVSARAAPGPCSRAAAAGPPRRAQRLRRFPRLGSQPPLRHAGRRRPPALSGMAPQSPRRHPFRHPRPRPQRQRTQLRRPHRRDRRPLPPLRPRPPRPRRLRVGSRPRLPVSAPSPTTSISSSTPSACARPSSSAQAPPAASVSACTTPPSSRCAASPTPRRAGRPPCLTRTPSGHRPAASQRSSPRPPAPTPTRPNPGPARRSARSHDRSAAAAPPDLPPADDWRTTAPAPPPTGSR